MISELAWAYCCEDLNLIENYELAINDKKLWVCHHRLETDLGISKQELKDIGRYYNQKANDLIFLTQSEHCRIHNYGNKNSLGKTQTKESNIKRSKSLKGRKFTNDHKEHISESRQGIIFTSEHRANISKSHRGLKHTEEHNNNISKSLKGNHPCPIKGKHRVYDNPELTKFHFE